mgnify:CR=1 FL=1
MSISENIEKYYSYSLEIIKKCKNRKERRTLITELILNLNNANVKFSQTKLAKILGVSRQLIKDIIDNINNQEIYSSLCNLLVLIAFKANYTINVKTQGRKKFEDNDPKIVGIIDDICRSTEHIDKSMKDEIIYTDVTLKLIKEKLIKEYNYTEKNCPSEKTISRIMKEKLKFKITKVKKDRVFKRIAETDEIFKVVFSKLKELKASLDNVIGISIDDKATKYVGKYSGLGYSWQEKHALDHDTNPEHIAKPFGIMDIKTKKVHVFCTTSNSTAEFKVDCIEEYLLLKLEENPNITKLMIYLDNGPENSSRRKLWKREIVRLVKKYNITIELIYYPPYHSKYNLIEHYWGVLQRHWSGLIIDDFDKLIGAINSCTWDGINSTGYLRLKQYGKGIIVTKEEIDEIDSKYVNYPIENLKKWYVTVNPLSE